MDQIAKYIKYITVLSILVYFFNVGMGTTSYWIAGLVLIAAAALPPLIIARGSYENLAEAMSSPSSICISNVLILIAGAVAIAPLKIYDGFWTFYSVALGLGGFATILSVLTKMQADWYNASGISLVLALLTVLIVISGLTTLSLIVPIGLVAVACFCYIVHNGMRTAVPMATIGLCACSVISMLVPSPF